ncbi:MAG TPA: TolC family protein [Bdellovibrionales bacterium]|nr:TolC family protein [Bdellovibrionales bacterium]
MGWYFLLAMLILGACETARAQSVSLDEYLAQVRRANPSIKAAELRATAQSSRVAPATTWDDPFFAIGLDKVPTEGEDMTSMTQYQLSQTIPIPGKLSAKGRAEEARAAAFKSDAELTARQISVAATQLYYRKYFNQKSKALIERFSKYLETLGASAKSAYKTGGTGHHDWLLARAEASVLKVEKLKLEREEKVILATMNQLRDQEPETPLAATDIEFNNDTKDDESSPSLSDSSELRSLNAMVESADADVSLSKLSYFPDFVIQGMYEKPRSMLMDEPPTWGVMIGISIPIFFFRKQSDLVQAAQSESQAARLDARQLENQLRTEVLDAKEQLKTAKATVELYKRDIIPVTELAVKNAQSGYGARRMPLIQLIESLRTQRQQELELVASQIDVELARLRLKDVLSNPPILRLGPSRPTLFGGGSNMGGMPSMSDTTSMGRGMSGPTRKPSKGTGQTSQPAMEGM